MEDLAAVLEEHGHRVEKVYLPHVDSPGRLLEQLAAYRWIDISAADRIICFRPPAHAIVHPNKVLWFIHHIRAFYDLWDTSLRGFPDSRANRNVRAALRAADTRALQEARSVFTNSKVVAQRLKRFNSTDSKVLYPPLYRPERFNRRGLNDEVVCISRIVSHKRQDLLIKAMKYTRTAVRLRLCGTGEQRYEASLRSIIQREGLADRVELQLGWLGEADKCRLLSECLAVAYVPVDEDSYGYLTLEAGHSRKAVITTTDSGGVLELIQHQVNGIVSDTIPQAIANAMDSLFLDRTKAYRMGDNAFARIRELNIAWPHIVDSLLE